MNKQDSFYQQMPTEEDIKKLFTYLDAEDKASAEAAKYRAENYYNCVDDYSYGGLCDKAADSSRFARQMARQRLKEQLENGGPFIEVFPKSVLCDQAGKIVSEKIVQGKYGACWIVEMQTGAAFIGVAKKPATYEKKGFQVQQKLITVEYYYLAKTGKSGSLIHKSRILKTEMSTEFPKYQNTHLPDVAFLVEN